MDMEASWERWYRRQGKDLLDRLEARRKVAVRDTWIAVVAVTIAAGLLLAQASGESIIYVVVGLPIAWVACLAVGRAWFQHQYKSELMPRLVRRLGGRFTYAPRGRMPREWYDRSGLFYRPVSVYAGEDLLTGEIGGVPLLLGELEVGTRQGDASVTVFQGLVITAPLPTPVHGRLSILLNNWTRILNRSDALPPGLDPVVDFDGSFGARFQVRGLPEAEARRVVTPEFQDKLLAFANQALAMGKTEVQPMADWQHAFRVEVYTEPSLALSIVDDRLYVAIHTGRDLFDPKLSVPANHPGTVRRYMAYLELLTGVLTALGFVVEDADAEAA